MEKIIFRLFVFVQVCVRVVFFLYIYLSVLLPLFSWMTNDINYNNEMYYENEYKMSCVGIYQLKVCIRWMDVFGLLNNNFFSLFVN